MAEMKLKEVREKFPQYKDLTDEQLVKGLHQTYYADMPFEKFSRQVGYVPREPGLEEVGLLESFIGPVKGYGMALPLIKTVEKFGAPTASRIAGQMLPKTGRELAAGAGLAGTAGVGGYAAGEMAPEEYKAAARQAGELAVALGLPLTTQIPGIRGFLGTGPTPAIPKERIEAARFMQERGAPAAPEQIQRGAQSAATMGRLESQQGAANKIYNESIGLKPKDAFGKTEFSEGKKAISNEYDTLLKDRNVTFDENFFNKIQGLLTEQQQLGASGVSFGQSRAILGALEKIGAIPKTLQDRIARLPRIEEGEATAKQSQEALSVLNDALALIRQQPQITMPAKAYNEIRSILGDAASRTANDRNASILRKMQAAFDNAADKSMPDIVRDLERVRLKYEALKTLEEAQLQSGVQIGQIPAEAVGAAIRKRIEQGSIYGTNNLLRQIGEAGQQLGISAPSTGKTLIDTPRGYSPQTMGFDVLKDVLGLSTYPFRAYSAGRRIAEPRTFESRIPPAIAAELERETK